MTLSDIETKYGFAYPELYRQLDRDGMLNVGEYGPDWYKVVFPTLKDKPTLLLHAYDFELLNTKGVSEAIETLTDPEGYRQIDPEFKFIPFAQTGAGDHYCFFISGQQGGDIPIVLIWHDQNEVNYLAKNLREFIFQMILNDMADQDTYNEVSDETFKTDFEKTLGTHSGYLTTQQVDILQGLLCREIIDYEVILPKGRKETHRGLLTDIEVEKIRQEIIPFDKIEESFKYSSAD